MVVLEMLGWFLVLEALTSVTSCTWDKAAHYPMFIYSNSDAAGVWQAGSGGLSGQYRNESQYSFIKCVKMIRTHHNSTFVILHIVAISSFSKFAFLYGCPLSNHLRRKRKERDVRVQLVLILFAGSFSTADVMAIFVELGI